MTVLVECRALHKAFGAIVAVDGISLSVRKGEVLGFLGPNGAGKSTTMKMITGFLEPDQGIAAICGIDVQASPGRPKPSSATCPKARRSMRR